MYYFYVLLLPYKYFQIQELSLHDAQCETLLSLTFYVKSNFAILGAQSCHFGHFGGLEF